MRPLYFLLKITVFYIARVYYKGHTTVNAPKKFKTKTIYTVNHASAFMDPWVPAVFQRPIVFFMTRGDIFKGWLKPILWAAHMLPIFRRVEDGADAHEKNVKVFRKVFDIFDRKKSIFIFAEGYTDDVFVRSLKPVKKGAARLAFDYYESKNWDTDLKVQAIGINYSDPNEFRGEVVCSNSKIIDPKDYKSLYLENKNKAITQLTKDIETAMRDQIICLANPEWTPFFDQIFTITKKGIVYGQYNASIDLKERWQYMKEKADFFNANYQEENEKWVQLKDNLQTYFSQLKSNKINDMLMWKSRDSQKLSGIGYWLLLILGLPFFLIGSVHNFLPFIFVKRFAENTFKRRVFWSGVKMMMGSFLDLLYNLPFIWLFYYLVYPSYWLGILYILTVPMLTGIFAKYYYNTLKDYFNFKKVSKSTLSDLYQQRKDLETEIKSLNLS
ncbi:MAG: 1-acyl-sn-glycerol-3-phosphate acyltransferase [Putridiphycobacter sp.]